MNKKPIVVYDNVFEQRATLFKNIDYHCFEEDFPFVFFAENVEITEFRVRILDPSYEQQEDIALVAVHDTFFESVETELYDYCKKMNIPLVSFSGSCSKSTYSNKKEIEILEIPSNWFYSDNLLCFLNTYKNDNKINLLLLAYGKNYKWIVLKKGVKDFLTWIEKDLRDEYHDVISDELLSLVPLSFKRELEDGIDAKYKKSIKKVINQYHELVKLFMETPYLCDNGIQIPDFKTHHSVANSWCLYNWSKYIGIPVERISVREKIEGDPYFQELLSKKKEVTATKLLPEIEGKGTIMLIDDEAENGWHLFFETLLSKNEKIKLISPKVTYNEIKTVDQLLSELSIFIRTIDPDVVILDLRLLQQDSITDPNFSSIEVLQKIKAFNKGIQVIVMTASNKVWNMRKFMNEGAYGYVVKESPLYDQEDSYAKTSIPRLAGLITEAFDRAELLKPLASKAKECICIVKLLQNHYTDNNSIQFLNEVGRLLDISWLLLESYPVNKQSLALAYFTYFQIAEKYGNLGLITKHKNNVLLIKQTDGNLMRVSLDNSPLRFYKERHAQVAHFKVENSKEEYKYSTLGNVSYLLACRLQFGNGDLYDWGQYVKLRNVFVHTGNYSDITKHIMHNFLDFIQKVLQNEHDVFI